MSLSSSHHGCQPFTKSDLSPDPYSNTGQTVSSSDLPVRRSPPTAQSTDKITTHLSPSSFSSPVGSPINSLQTGTNETLLDFWPPAHLISGSVTTSEPLTYGKSYTSSHPDATVLSDQNELISDIRSLSSVTTEAVLTSPTTPPAPSTLTDSDRQSSISNLESTSADLLSVTSPRPNHLTQNNLDFSRHALPPNSVAVLQAALPLFRSVITPPPKQIHSPNPLASTLARDTLLTYAHRMFVSPFQPVPGLAAPPVICEPSSPLHPYNAQLLPLLRNLKILHPKHIPILLLLGCVYHAVGDYTASLQQNEEILAIEENFVEAMSNVGTTLKTMGRINDAEKWWWRAISLKPVYWDAIYNLMNILITSDSSENEDESKGRRMKALELCDHLRSRFIDRNGLLRVDVPANELHHVQNILYVGATIRGTESSVSPEDNLVDLMQGIEILLCFDSQQKTLSFSFIDFALAGTVAALILTSALPPSMVSLISSWESSKYSPAVSDPGTNLLEFVHDKSYDILDLLLLDSDGNFPTVFLSPSQASQLTNIVLSTYQGCFPAFFQRTWQGSSSKSLSNYSGAEIGKISSNILLNIAKTLQEKRLSWLPGFDGRVRSSPSFVLIMYYFAFCIHPSPPTCNNLGILLSTSPWATPISTTATGQPYVHQLAKEYYEEGMRLLMVEELPQWKNSHPHLLTNYGSLLKEMGNIDSAIEIYTEAIKLNPNFGIALANLANAMKDSGRLPESILYYRRAVEVNEELPEALCGMVHAVWSVCDWRGLGKIGSSMSIDYVGKAHPTYLDGTNANGWMPKLIEVTQKQISAAYNLNHGIVRATGTVEEWLGWIEASCNMPLSSAQRTHWTHIIQRYFMDINHEKEMINEGGFIIRIVEWLSKVLQWRWYNEVYGNEFRYPPGVRPLYKSISDAHKVKYRRPRVPPTMSVLPVSSVLPFHTFIYPLNARELRLVARRNAFRTSHLTLTQPWLPEHVYPPPPPPHPRINIGYVSSDFNDHPTAHLLQSVFEFHDRKRFCVYAYATTVSDHSRYRTKIETESEYFRDVSDWSTQQVVEQIIQDEIHILVNLNGYTKGARNDIFAARPSPVQVSFLGFAGTLAAGWCDYMICDVTSCPPGTRLCEICERNNKQDDELTNSSEIDFNIGPDPESTDDWKYAEKLIYMPHTYLVTDHKQLFGSGADEADINVIQQAWKRTEARRRILREAIFPDLLEDTVIFANFNQMYKIDPSIFATWLRILKRVPNSILWLLRFPSAAEEHLLRTAELWEGAEIKSRLRFTEVAPKVEHIERVCVADIFLDTVECNAHTVAADVLWSGIPVITWPKYDFKMCSRVGASIAHATGYGRQMVVDSLAAYEGRAVELALSATSIQRSSFGDGLGELATLRRNLFMSRGSMPLFDTHRWTRNLEKAYDEAWRRWVQGGTFLHFNVGNSEHQYERCNGFIWVKDEET